ncbi:MAG: hypothetical protein L3J83_02620, partial [Proteobacteria bacterium]|nr:hypothetical protein [Pseudomonadota bacterium]
DINTFFDLITKGSQVEIKNASFDTSTGQVTGGTILIKKVATKRQRVTTKEIIGSGIVGGFVSGTITSVDGSLFSSGFE